MVFVEVAEVLSSSDSGSVWALQEVEYSDHRNRYRVSCSKPASAPERRAVHAQWNRV